MIGNSYGPAEILTPEQTLPQNAVTVAVSERGIVKLTQRDQAVILTPAELDALWAVIR